MVEIANALARRGRAVDLLVVKSVGPLQERVDPAVNVISLDMGRIAFSIFPLVRYLRINTPRVLMGVDEHVHILSLLARPFARVRPKVVLRVGNMLSELFNRYQGKAKLMAYIVPRIYKWADMVIGNSQGVARDVAQVCGIKPERIRVIFNPKDLGAIQTAAQESVELAWLAPGHTEFVVVWFGRLREQKNLPHLFRAFAVLQRSTESRLVIVGQGREQGRLEALVNELGIKERVYFAGYQDNPYKFVSRADVYVLPSLWEGLPNALIEALVCGTPAIAADCDSGPREILAPGTDPYKRIKDGVEWAEYGALIPVNGEQELVEALTSLIADEGKRSRYKMAALERAKAFDAEDIISQYIEALGV